MSDRRWSADGAVRRLAALRGRAARERATNLPAPANEEGAASVDGAGTGKGPGAGAGAGPGVRYCRECGYELTGIDWSPAACPECGEGFDPFDLDTTLPDKLENLRRARVNRVMFAVLAALLVTSGLMYTVIPRPERLNDWRLWLWMGERWGVDHVWLGRAPGWVYYWAGRPFRAERESNNGGIAWEIVLRGDDEWTLQVHEAGVAWQEVMSPFNAIKREMFGIVFSRWAREECEAPFEVRGGKIDVMTALVKTYGLQVQPFVMREEQDYVWVYDAERERLTTLGVAEAEARGIEVRRQVNPFEERRLIAPPVNEQ